MIRFIGIQKKHQPFRFGFFVEGSETENSH